jgi:glutathione S-transferase
MVYELYIGDHTFSSWSLRGWLMLKSFDIPFKSQMLELYNGTFEKDLAPIAPAWQVPFLKTPKGHIVFDTIAIAETLAEAHPSAALWPKDPAQRGRGTQSCGPNAQRLFRPATERQVPKWRCASPRRAHGNPSDMLKSHTVWSMQMRRKPCCRHSRLPTQMAKRFDRNYRTVWPNSAGLSQGHAGGAHHCGPGRQ